MDDSWSSGNPYEYFMGRWSRRVASEFLAWFGAAPGKAWLDLGCGTGALSRLILASQAPSSLWGIDYSPQFIEHAQNAFTDANSHFRVGSAEAIPAADDQFEVLVSGLMLNFVPKPAQAVAEMRRVTVPGGKIGVYLWDYGDRMQMLRYFWDAAIALNPAAQALDEAVRFPLCQEAPLQALFANAGFQSVEVAPVEAETRFKDFDDFWRPFLGQVGPAPSYVNRLDEAERARLVQRLQDVLPQAPDGSIPLVARAWAVKAVV